LLNVNLIFHALSHSQPHTARLMTIRDWFPQFFVATGVCVIGIISRRFRN
jgi:hypothetical protein